MLENFKLHTLSRNPQEEYREFYDLYSPFIKENDWVLDIGSHTGDSSVPMYSLCGDLGKVICIEPNPEVFRILEQNVRENHLSHVFDIFNVAAYNSYCKKEFAYCENNAGIMEGFSNEVRGNPALKMDFNCVNIEKFLIDRYSMERLKKNLRFLKLDTEGQDSAILKYLGSIVTEIKPTIIIEWWFESGSRQTEIFSTIKELGYNAYRSDNKKLTDGSDFETRSHDLVLIHESKIEDLK